MDLDVDGHEYGTFGEVALTESEAVKRTQLIYEDHQGCLITSNNLIEAACAQRIRRLREAYCDVPNVVPNVVPYHGVSMEVRGTRGITLELRMARARLTLCDFIKNAAPQRRADCFGRVALGVVRGVLALHATGMLHGDIKPGNVVVFGPVAADMVESDGDVAVIDLGSSSAFSRCLAPSPVRRCCTVAYVPPEAFGDDSTPCSTGTDAFSVGALLWEYAHGEMYATPRESVDYADSAVTWAVFKRLHLEPGSAGYLDQRRGARPGGFCQAVWRVVEGLLDPAPKRRLCLDRALELVLCAPGARMHPEETLERPVPRELIVDAADVDGWSSPRARRLAIAQAFSLAQSPTLTPAPCAHCGPLASNYLDRFVCAERRDPTPQELSACVCIAAVLVCHTPWDAAVNSSDIAVVARVLQALQFDLYPDTCDVLLAARWGYAPEHIDYRRVRHAIVRSGRCSEAAARAYVRGAVALSMRQQGRRTLLPGPGRKDGPGLPAGGLGCGRAGIGQAPVVPLVVDGKRGDPEVEPDQRRAAQRARH
jgi:hypothetical protein